MTSQRVIPVEPLVAQETVTYHEDDEPWRIAWPEKHWYTDAEFAAHFMPAEPLEALLAAVGALVAVWDVMLAVTPDGSAAGDVRAAYRAYVEAKP